MLPSPIGHERPDSLETGRLVVPRNSILIFRRRNQKLLWLVADYICGGEETRHMYHIWHLIILKYNAYMYMYSELPEEEEDDTPFDFDDI